MRDIIPAIPVGSPRKGVSSIKEYLASKDTKDARNTPTPVAPPEEGAY